MAENLYGWRSRFVVPMLDEYEKLTEFKKTNPDALFRHRMKRFWATVCRLMPIV